MAPSQEEQAKEQFFVNLYGLDDLACESDDSTGGGPMQTEPSTALSQSNAHFKHPSIASRQRDSPVTHHPLTTAYSYTIRLVTPPVGNKNMDIPRNQKYLQSDRPPPKLAHKASSLGRTKLIPKEYQVFNGHTFCKALNPVASLAKFFRFCS
jgi:hypothetical protein